MTSYAPVAESGGVPQGHQVPAGDTFHDSGGVRREWWWEDGPVDTCCCCCTLRTGVGLLAACDLFVGVLTFAALGFIDVIAGAVGLYAVSFDNSQAARVYMLSWPAKFVLGLLRTLQLRWSAKVGLGGKGIEGPDLMMTGVNLLVFLYYFKVCWSYYTRRADEKRARNSSASSTAVYQEQPMLPMAVVA